MGGDFGPFSIINSLIHLCYETSNLHNHIRKREMEHLSEEQVMNFVKTAMLHNQDIRKATIERE